MLKKAQKTKAAFEDTRWTVLRVGSSPTVLDILALQVLRAAGCTTIEIQTMAKGFPVVDAAGFAECERRKHPGQVDGASRYGHNQPHRIHTFSSSMPKTLADEKTGANPASSLTVEYFPRSGRAGRGEYSHIGGQTSKSQQGCWVDGLVLKRF